MADRIFIGLIVWTAASLVLGILWGKFCKAGRGKCPDRGFHHAPECPVCGFEGD